MANLQDFLKSPQKKFSKVSEANWKVDSSPLDIKNPRRPGRREEDSAKKREEPQVYSGSPGKENLHRSTAKVQKPAKQGTTSTKTGHNRAQIARC